MPVRPHYPPPYPNPAAVVYPTTTPPRFPPQLTTVTEPPAGRPDAASLYQLHNHQAWVDKHGDGVTDVAAGHYHRVKGGTVQADPSDGHTHKLTGLPSGAGGAFRNFPGGG